MSGSAFVSSADAFGGTSGHPHAPDPASFADLGRHFVLREPLSDLLAAERFLFTTIEVQRL
jgi:hypothetical protein